MLERVSSYIQSCFTSQNSSSTNLPTSSSFLYASSFSSIADNKKGKGLIAGIFFITGLIYLWKSKWNPLQGLFSSKVIEIPIEIPKEITSSVARETYKAVKQGYYLNAHGKKFKLRSGEELLAKSEFYPNKIKLFTPPKLFNKTQTDVVNQDCLDVAQKEKENGGNVAVLMFASPLEAGGGMADSNNGQEEDLCRRSDIFGFMWDQAHFVATNQLYPLVSLQSPTQVDPSYAEMEANGKNGMIHVPQVTVFRASKAQSYAFLDKPFEVGMLISPAPNKPTLTAFEEFANYTRSEDVGQVWKLITTQLSVACKNGYDTVILGAFGCGAFSNPPQTVALLYQTIIQNHFKGAFKKIVFAILDDSHRKQHNPMGNLKPFQDCFPVVQST